MNAMDSMNSSHTKLKMNDSYLNLMKIQDSIEGS